MQIVKNNYPSYLKLIFLNGTEQKTRKFIISPIFFTLLCACTCTWMYNLKTFIVHFYILINVELTFKH